MAGSAVRFLRLMGEDARPWISALGGRGVGPERSGGGREPRRRAGLDRSIAGSSLSGGEVGTQLFPRGENLPRVGFSALTCGVAQTQGN